METWNLLVASPIKQNGLTGDAKWFEWFPARESVQIFELQLTTKQFIKLRRSFKLFLFTPFTLSSLFTSMWTCYVDSLRYSHSAKPWQHPCFFAVPSEMHGLWRHILKEPHASWRLQVCIPARSIWTQRIDEINATYLWYTAVVLVYYIYIYNTWYYSNTMYMNYIHDCHMIRLMFVSHE